MNTCWMILWFIGSSNSVYRQGTYVSHPLALVLFSPEAILLIETVFNTQIKSSYCCSSECYCMWHVGVWAIHVRRSLSSSLGSTWLVKRLSILMLTEFLLLLCKQQSDWALNYTLTVLWSFSHLRSKCKPSFNMSHAWVSFLKAAWVRMCVMHSH